MGIRAIACIALAFYISIAGVTSPALALLVGFVVICDYYDGVIFRKTHYSGIPSFRSVRRVLDSSIDRVSVQIVSVSVLLSDPEYLPIFLIILFREIMVCIPCVGAYRKGIVIYPKLLSKISTASVAVIGSAYIVGCSSVSIALALPVVLMGCMSFLQYRHTKLEIDLGQASEGIDYELRAF